MGNISPTMFNLTDEYGIWVYKIISDSGTQGVHVRMDNGPVYVDCLSKDDRDCIETMLKLFGIEEVGGHMVEWTYYVIEVEDCKYKVYLSRHKQLYSFAADALSYPFRFEHIKNNHALYEYLYKWRSEDVRGDQETIKNNT